ncbi:Rpn family recombination-promoting nuclease/putative transposase [Leptolyngbya sp. 7M]|uniref:Rpn family recombination-promoting nuclease/putative transposase n=1 Tax=Leptolyngbya sp. 7M TaxID=2812896 RepID=UPI001B8B2467|nr:Rpn family recombination-promoting nuclease/putative transposase [Leptolyngbya sp. 7M]QYO64568.1 Rpn family recombination-promoting nuclease/putative transposase [Leptolyngbya sp. 7M]
MRQDAIFYQLFKRFPTLFFELIAIPPEQARGYRFESVEVKEPSFRIDGVFLPPPDAPDKVVFFAEVQFQKDQSLYHRFFSELFLYLRRNPEQFDDWQGVLIFPSRGLEPDKTAFYRSLLNSSQVQHLYLDELTITDESSIGLSLMQLTIAPEAQVAEQARRLVERAQTGDSATLSASEIIDIVVTIAAYKFANLSREEIQAMIGVSLEEIPLFREVKAEGRAEGRQEALLETVPLLLELGLSVEQIAARLKLDVDLIRIRLMRRGLDCSVPDFPPVIWMGSHLCA